MYSQIFTELSSIQPELDKLAGDKPLPPLAAFVDGRGLACPLPLLKSKLALKPLTAGTIYTIATDKNSATDIRAFCEKNALMLECWESETDTDATIFHFLITKNS